MGSKQETTGDIESFEKLYRDTAGFVYNVAYRMVHSHQDAEEITQEVFLKVYRKLKYFRGRSAVKTWLYRITVNCAINRLNKASRERKKRDIYQADLNSRGAYSEPESASGDGEKTIQPLLKALNPDQRACVVLRNIEGLSYLEIAKALNIGVNTVRTRLLRARRKLLELK